MKVCLKMLGIILMKFLNLDNNNIEANAGVIKSYIAEKNLG